MSNKRDKISNYNLSYLNLLEASNELSGFVNGLSNNDIFAFTEDETLKQNISEISTIGPKETDDEKFINEIAVNILDRTAGSYYMKDITGGAVSNFIKQTGEYIDIVNKDLNSLPQGNINNFIDSFFSYKEKETSPVTYVSMSEMLTYETYKDNQLTMEYSVDPELIGKDKKYKTKSEALKSNDVVSFPSVKENGELSGQNEILKNTDEPNRFLSPGLSAMVVKHPRIGIMAKGKSHLPVFFNAINPVEMSKCVPYINIKILTLDFSSDKKGSSILNLNFTRDSHGGFSNTRSIQSVGSNETSSDKNLETLDQTFMDIFTATQTMSNGDINGKKSRFNAKELSGGTSLNRNPVLEPIMPLMTLKNLNVSITGAGYGIMSSKSANISLVLHDRSRLRDISPLVSSSKFASTKIEIEYGWNHPEGGVNSGNVFGRYLDSLKEKAVYSVIGSSYKFGSGGEVDIDIKLAAYGYRQNERIHAGMGPVVPLNFINDLIESAVAEVVKDNSDKEDIPEIRQKIRTTGRNGRDINSCISWEQYKEIIKILNGNSEVYSVSDSDISRSEILLDAIKLLISEKQGLSSSTSVSEESKQIKKILESNGNFNDADKNKLTEPVKILMGKIKAFELYEHPDPFLFSYVYNGSYQKEDLRKKGVFGMPISLQKDSKDMISYDDDGNIQTHVTLGKALCSLVGYPLMSSCLYDEVQMVFYPLNHNAGAARIHTTASLPIPVPLLLKEVQDKLKNNSFISIKSIFGLIENKILRDKNLKAYGLSDIKYKDDKEFLAGISSDNQKIAIVNSLIRERSIPISLDESKAADREIRKIAKNRNKSYESIKKTISDNKDVEDLLSKYSAGTLKTDIVKKYNEIFSDYRKIIADRYDVDLKSKLEGYYSTDGLADLYKFSEVKFVRPNITMDFEVIPVIDYQASDRNTNVSDFWAGIRSNLGKTFENLNPFSGKQEKKSGLKEGKTILRIHVYDEEAVQSPSEHMLLNNMINENSSKLISGTSKDQEVASSGKSINEYLSSLKFWDVKQIVKRAYPTINYGSAGSTINSISVSSQTNGAMANVLSIEAYGNIKNGSVKGFNYENDFDTTTVFPNEVSVEMIGMPMIGRGSSVFIDFNTNTSLDNIYTVKNVNHSLGEGQFNTSVKLVPTNMGAINSFVDNIKNSIEKIPRKQ